MNMNTEFKICRKIGEWSLLLLILGSCAVAVAQPLEGIVRLEINSSETQLTISTWDTLGPCLVQNHGDICVPRNQAARIMFQLVPANPACSSGHHWKLHKVVLGGEGSSSKPSPDSWGGLSKSAMSDFDAEAYGEVNPFSSSPSQITISDNNDYELILWYRVDAICVDNNGDPIILDEEPITLSIDPRIRNGGTE
jgi:hypothetical protein